MMVKRTKKRKKKQSKESTKESDKKDPRWKYLLINTAGKSTIKFLKRREKSTYQTNF